MELTCHSFLHSRVASKIGYFWIILESEVLSPVAFFCWGEWKKTQPESVPRLSIKNLDAMFRTFCLCCCVWVLLNCEYWNIWRYLHDVCTNFEYIYAMSNFRASLLMKASFREKNICVKYFFKQGQWTFAWRWFFFMPVDGGDLGCHWKSSECRDHREGVGALVGRRRLGELIH